MYTRRDDYSFRSKLEKEMEKYKILNVTTGKNARNILEFIIFVFRCCKYFEAMTKRNFP